MRHIIWFVVVAGLSWLAASAHYNQRIDTLNRQLDKVYYELAETILRGQ